MGFCLSSFIIPNSSLILEGYNLSKGKFCNVRFLLEQALFWGVFLLVLGGLVFFHELGHFLASIWCGVPVKEFGIGFPPRLIGTALDKNGNRRWFGIKSPPDVDSNSMILSLNWIPLGGFVRPAGEDDPLVLNGLSAAPKRVRFAVLAAGRGESDRQADHPHLHIYHRLSRTYESNPH